MALDANADYPAFLYMLQRALHFDLRKNASGTPGQTYEAGPTIYEQLAAIPGRFDNIDKAVAGVAAPQLTDAQIDQLAADIAAKLPASTAATKKDVLDALKTLSIQITENQS
jgi:mono/diheme cytochrome c family protein